MTACPATYSNRLPEMSIESRRERGEALSTRASGTVRSVTKGQFSGRLTLSFEHRAENAGPWSADGTDPRSSPLALVAVHPAVGGCQQRFVAVAVVWEHRRPGTHHHRDADVGLHIEPNAVDRLLQLAPLAFRFFAAATRDHDDELIACVAHADVVWTNRGAQNPRHLAQRAIANMVPERVVDFLEVVEVHDDQRDLRPQPIGTRELPREVHEHEARIGQTRQRIRQRIFLRLFEHD